MKREEKKCWTTYRLNTIHRDIVIPYSSANQKAIQSRAFMGCRVNRCQRKERSSWYQHSIRTELRTMASLKPLELLNKQAIPSVIFSLTQTKAIPNKHTKRRLKFKINWKSNKRMMKNSSVIRISNLLTRQRMSSKMKRKSTKTTIQATYKVNMKRRPLSKWKTEE